VRQLPRADFPHTDTTAPATWDAVALKGADAFYDALVRAALVPPAADTATDSENRSGDPRRSVTREKRDRCCDILGCSFRPMAKGIEAQKPLGGRSRAMSPSTAITRFPDGLALERRWQPPNFDGH